MARNALATLLVLFALVASSPPVTAAPLQGEPVNGFPSWGERVIHAWINRARCDPQQEMTLCGGACSEGACYAPVAPLPWSLALNRAARFHSDEMLAQSYNGHDSICTLVPNIDALYPGSCTGPASCACVGGTSSCNPTCTTWNQRINLFGATAAGELIATGSGDPSTFFYVWLYETNMGTVCSFGLQNGHRWLILKSSGSVGSGIVGSRATVDFGTGGTPGKIPSGSHYPRNTSLVDVWANWYDTSGPSEALVNVDGTTYPLTLARGTLQNGAWTASIGPGMDSGCHRYYFIFRDAAGTTYTYPGTGSLGIGPAGCADWDGTRPLTAHLICLGDGSPGNLCPCSNSGGAGRGCANSQNALGALLTATGNVQPDTLVLTSAGELPSSLTIFLQGNVHLQPSVHFGDGLRCAGGALKRIANRSASGGTVSYPSVGDPSISARSTALGDPIPMGTSRYYQAYYRDPNVGFCAVPTGSTFNASSGRQTVW